MLKKWLNGEKWLFTNCQVRSRKFIMKRKWTTDFHQRSDYRKVCSTRIIYNSSGEWKNKRKGDCSDTTRCVQEEPAFCRKLWQAMKSEPSSTAHNQKSTVSQSEGSNNIKNVLTSFLDINRITHYEFVPVRSGISMTANLFKQLNLWWQKCISQNKNEGPYTKLSVN